MSFAGGAIRKSISLEGGDRLILVDYGMPNTKVNLFRIGSSEGLVWQAETIDGSPYFDVNLERDKVTAYSFDGWLAVIDLASGKILSKQFVK